MSGSDRLVSLTQMFLVVRLDPSKKHLVLSASGFRIGVQDGVGAEEIAVVLKRVCKAPDRTIPRLVDFTITVVVESVADFDGPIAHHVRAEMKGHEPVTVNVELRQGEKNRTILIEIAPAEGTAEERKVKRPVPLATWISAGIAVAGAAVGTGFYIAAASERKELERSCAPLCTDEETKGLRLKGMGADIGAGVAVVSGITALVFYLARPSVPRNEEKLEAKNGMRWDVAVSPRGGALTLRGTL